MGREKERFITMQERGFGFSNEYVCESCFGDKYLKKVIQKAGKVGTCSYCRYCNGKKKRKKVLLLDDLMPYIMETIKSEFFDSEEMLPWDSENEVYIGNDIDVYDLVHEELNKYMECEHEALLKEIYDMLLIGNQVSRYNFERRKEEVDFQGWKIFCELVKKQDLSPEEIVNAAFSKEASKELREIRKILEMIKTYSQELYMNEMVYTYHYLYRCRKDIEKNSDVTAIRASDIGTAPTEYARENRMSTRGDMMFYGAARKNTAFAEIEAKKGDTITTGVFHTNKQIRVLNLHRLYRFSCPSIFDAENRDRRSVWNFYRDFMKDISRPIKSKNSEIGNEYKPTQVFTKFVQKRMGLSGIIYNSSHLSVTENEYVGVNGEECYVLFVDHQNCINEGEKIDKKKLQLILQESPTQETYCGN